MTQNKKKKEILKHNIRKKIYFLILKFPGIHFNELLRKGKFASGQLTYHLSILEKNKLIYKEKGKVVNYYTKEYKKTDNKFFQILRDKRKREIVLFFLEKKVITYDDIKLKLNLSTSTISWHLKDLEKQEIIISKINKKKKYYFLDSEVRNEFKYLLHKEKKSIVSSLVDSFIEFWDGDF